MPIRRRALMARSRSYRFKRRMGLIMRRTGRRRPLARIMNIMRRPIRAERKWAIISGTSTNIPPNTTYATALTPTTIPLGTDVNSRIGNQVNFLRISYHVKLQNNSGTNNATAPTKNTGLVRMVIWTPVVDFTAAQTYALALTTTTNIDFNILRVVREKYLYLSPPYLATTVSATPTGGTSPYSRHLFFNIPFPRKVHFNSATGIVDEEKYSMYVTFITDELDLIFTHNAKTWYVDT